MTSGDQVTRHEDQTRSLALGDVDGDGDPDLVVGNEYQRNRLFLNDGRGVFLDATASSVPPDRLLLLGAGTTGDVDGDGDPDLVVGAVFEQNRLYVNRGDGTFVDGTSRLPADQDPSYSVAVGDVDGDGAADLVFGNVVLPNRLYLNDGVGNFADETAARMPPDTQNTYALAMGDVDLDGDSDLVLGNDGQNQLYLNDGAGRFVDVTATLMPQSIEPTRAVLLGDVDGDGDLDGVFGNFGQDRLYLNGARGGAPGFTDVTAERFPAGVLLTNAAALGDVDGDGDLDLILGDTRGRLYLNDGTGSFTDETEERMPDARAVTTSGLALGDVDGDGDPDLALCGAAQNRLYLNDGAGSFTDVTSARMPPGVVAGLAMIDVDGNDDPDLVGFGPTAIYFNVRRRLDAPLLLLPGRRYQLDAYARYGPGLGDVALALLAPATARIPTPYGTLGLDPSLMVALPLFPIPASTGIGTVSVQVPALPSLVGAAVHAQALLPLPALLTNVTMEVISSP
ncbi:MAG: VCBS repeat-containing protein [Planctomycetota bacterium]